MMSFRHILKPMKIVFIRPNWLEIKYPTSMEPLSMAILSALTPPGIEKVFFDEQVEDIDFNAEADLVAITADTFSAKRAYQIARLYRERNIPVVMGGFHATLMPDEVGEHVDAVAVGDAEGMWGKIIEDAQQGVLKPLYQSETRSFMGVRPDRSIFKGKKYIPFSLVQFSRGCRFDCDFCSVRRFYNEGYFVRPLEEIISEIKTFTNKRVFIVDDNFFVNRRKTKELLEALIPLKIQWGTQISIDITKNSDLMDLLQASGCKIAFIGFESLRTDNLAQIGKKVNYARMDFIDAIEEFHKRGIMIDASFVFGYDHDTNDSFDRTLEFALQQKFFHVNFGVINPMPGTRLYDRLENEGRLIYDKWWLHPDYRLGRASFNPKQMSADFLGQEVDRIQRKVRSFGSIFKRSFERRTSLSSLANIFLYYAFNLNSRKEWALTSGIKLTKEE